LQPPPGAITAGKAGGGAARIFGLNNLILLAVAFSALIATAATSFILAQRNREAFELATRTETLLNDASQTLELLEDAETGQRGFLLTGKPAYLQPYVKAAAAIPGQLDHLVDESQDMAVADLAQQLRIKGLAKLAEVTHVLDRYRDGGREQALGEVNTDVGKNLMDDVRELTLRLRTRQDALLGQRLATASATGRILVAAQVGTVVLVLAISALTGYGLYQNLIALRAAQGELAATNLNLETIVASRTMALSRANDEIQKFAYIVSHDLRAPLVNIMGFTSELEAAARTVGRYIESRAGQPGDAPAEVRAVIAEDVPEAFGFIKASTAKMDRLIGAILKLSREGRRVLTAEPIAMRPLIEMLAGTLKHRTDEIGATIVIEEPLPNLIADRLAIEQIFGNLLDNAVKYLMPDRPGRVIVRGKVRPPFALFEIEDNGRGVAESDRERIFELFRRAGGQDVPGEGIGLAFVRQLVHRLDGAIDLDSSLAQGTIFRLSLPLVQRKSQRESA
jgi:signal transduction histidine kinase